MSNTHVYWLVRVGTLPLATYGVRIHLLFVIELEFYQVMEDRGSIVALPEAGF